MLADEVKAEREKPKPVEMVLAVLPCENGYMVSVWADETIPEGCSGGCGEKKYVAIDNRDLTELLGTLIKGEPVGGHRSIG